MAKSAKKSAKSSNNSPTFVRSPSGPRPPFTKAPDSLRPFLEPLSPQQVYLVHVDNTSTELKRRAFNFPILINVLVAAVIALRAYAGLYFYPAMLATLFGISSSTMVDTSVTPVHSTLRIILQRTTNMVFDYILLTIFLPWPVRFIQGPVRWRRTIDFRDREVIVRQSKHSWTKDLVRDKWVHDDKEARDRIVAAVTPEQIAKTGFMLIDASWNLDYDAMIRAHEMVDRTRHGQGTPLYEFRTTVLVNTDAYGWLIWRIGDESVDGKKRMSQREQILAFKDKLTDMGKEDLFFRWVEIIQYESTRPGGFTPERQHAAMAQAKKLFEDNDVDFSQFWREVGGMEGLSGFED